MQNACGALYLLLIINITKAWMALPMPPAWYLLQPFGNHGL